MAFNSSQIAATGLALLTGMGRAAQATLAPPIAASLSAQRVEKHPEMRAARRNLQQAKLELQKGAHNFKGKRVEALKSTNKAIAEVEQAGERDR